MQRIGLIIVPGIIAIALYLGINTLDTLSEESATSTTLPGLEFNAYSEGINTILYDAEGNINYTLQAERQVHYNDDRTELVNPFIRLFQDGDSRWNIVANSGEISSGDMAEERIDLLGDVQVFSLDDFGNRTVMSTESLVLNPGTETLETDQPVSVVTSTLLQSSLGILANLRTDEIIFHSEIRGQYAQPTN